MFWKDISGVLILGTEFYRQNNSENDKGLDLEDD